MRATPCRPFSHFLYSVRGGQRRRLQRPSRAQEAAMLMDRNMPAGRTRWLALVHIAILQLHQMAL